ncbi:hypothetical protein SNOG_00921 [Parastagonospora nodorum SN15]|uniref:DUF1989 domain-containing protein n=1 Tax=Phaeosphaeria nodorum (strain SN15 / ATCC MYA-4574 / FGSC 10173) TaxID=321614 RepID=Q0V4Z3_PHANO|nr:hypothetical protein SNOG_00921 [Parastagonospora nodorum SN15]EAT92416.2 hypothetical protein SNOG_00921 [Parastagonospora nodorum SN15]
MGAPITSLEAVVSVLSAIERQQKKKRNKTQGKELELEKEDMSGELQTIPARHGVATFVPRGRTIKVINTYGKQVVSMWAFSLGAPPEEGEGEGEAEDIDEDKVREEAEGLKNAVEGKDGGMESGEKDEKIEKKDREEDTNEADKTKPDDDDPPEQAPDTPENEKTTETTASSSKQPTKRTWGSYLPSIPYRNKGAPKKEEGEKKPSAQDEKTQNEANTKKWSSYLPTGKGFSSYVPNVQIPDSKSAISAFQSSHNRDPNKSYAEQLHPWNTSPLPHTRASSHKLVPEVDDILLTNLRNPIITLVEDTTPGAHDTLTAACDANLYSALGTDKPEEHGSCAENLVLALKELNEGAGLKGAKAIGADITVNIAPTPLHLFMNAPLDVANISSIDGAGAKGAILSVDEPKGKKRSYVRFRADRDVVVVFSACPMDVGKQNGGRCMAANFMVEDVKEGEDLASSVASLNNTGKKGTPKQSSSEKHVEKKPEIDVKGEEQKQDIEQDFEQPKIDAETKDTTQEKTTPQESKPTKKSPPKKLERKPSEKPAEKQPAQVDSTKSDESKPKKKPKKLQVRSSATPAPA